MAEEKSSGKMRKNLGNFKMPRAKGLGQKKSGEFRFQVIMALLSSWAALPQCLRCCPR
jgi:hypothetical protein